MDKGRKLEESLEKAWKLEEVTWWERKKREGRASAWERNRTKIKRKMKRKMKRAYKWGPSLLK